MHKARLSNKNVMSDPRDSALKTMTKSIKLVKNNLNKDMTMGDELC